MTVRTFLFYTFSVIAIVSAILCITRKSPVASVVWLVCMMFHLASLYVLLDAYFIAAVQVLVYAGAIMVLFLFVIMLLNIGRLGVGPGDMKGAGGKVIAIVAGLVMLGELMLLRRVAVPGGLGLPEGAIAAQQAREGAIHAVAQPLFTSYLLPFEITSVMLLAAVVGAVVLAKRRI